MKKLLFIMLVGLPCFIQAQTKKENIHEAVEAGDLKKVQVLLEADPTLLELKDENDRTPLLGACLNRKTMKRQPEIAKFLIEKGANVNVVDNWLQTPLIASCLGYGPDFDLIKHLVAKNADINVMGTNGITPIHWAVFYGDIDLARFLIDKGADINIYDKFNGSIRGSSISGTVLQVAINYKPENLEMIKLIIEKGAKLNKKDSQGNTELHLAALKGSVEIVKLLVEHGADVNEMNKYNRTSTYYAAKHGYRSVADLLIASGANKNSISETNYGKAPQLTEILKDGEAFIWSLGNAYTVKTKGNLMIFTMFNRIDNSPEAGLANGNLNSDELTGQKITMFINHRGRLQMGGKDFEQQGKLVDGINLVSSFKPDFSKKENPSIPAYRLALPNEIFSIHDIKVHTIPALAGGLGYLVEADGIKVFYAGLHISGNEPEQVEKFRKEIDFLKPFGPIDIVMLTVHSHSNDIGMDYEPYFYLIDQLSPKSIYLFGANVPETYKECIEVLKVRNIPIFYPEGGSVNGERYHYLKNKKEK